MSREVSHEEAFAALDAAALDALDVSERDAVLWHAAGCAICSAELTSLRDTAAMLAFSSPLAADTATRRVIPSAACAWCSTTRRRRAA